MWNWKLFTVLLMLQLGEPAPMKPQCYVTEEGAYCGEPCGTGRWMLNLAKQLECKKCPANFFFSRTLLQCGHCSGEMTNNEESVRTSCKDHRGSDPVLITLNPISTYPSTVSSSTTVSTSAAEVKHRRTTSKAFPEIITSQKPTESESTTVAMDDTTLECDQQPDTPSIEAEVWIVLCVVIFVSILFVIICYLFCTRVIQRRRPAKKKPLVKDRSSSQSSSQEGNVESSTRFL